MQRPALGLTLGLAAGFHYARLQHILPAIQGALQAQLISYIVPPITLVLVAVLSILLPPFLSLLPLLIFSLTHTAHLPRIDLILTCLLPSVAVISHRASFLTAIPAFLAALHAAQYISHLQFLPALCPTTLVAASTVLLASNSLYLRHLYLTPARTKATKRRRLSRSARIVSTLRRIPVPLYALSLFVTSFLLTRNVIAPIGKRLIHRLHPRLLPPGYAILAQTRSTTGLITVLELTGRYRMLTADLSVLGGLHIKPGYDHDSIFSQFYVHEAVRLTRLPHQSAHETGGREGRTLCIGLGIGVVAQGLHTLGSQVDVVEIDPVVVRYAQRYFGFNVPNVYTQDALVFLNQAVQNNNVRIYDYVVHDVFTGGSVPLDLFAQHTFDAMEAVMKEDGVLAVNFVGMLDDPTALGTRSVAVVYDRLASVFGHVAAFGDGDSSRLHNIVFFASHVPERLTFRTPVERDFLQSGNREIALTSFLKHRIERSQLGAQMGSAESSDWFLRMGQWETAAIHIQLMRKLHGSTLWRALLAHEIM